MKIASAISSAMDRIAPPHRRSTPHARHGRNSALLVLSRSRGSGFRESFYKNHTHLGAVQALQRPSWQVGCIPLFEPESLSAPSGKHLPPSAIAAGCHRRGLREGEARGQRGVGEGERRWRGGGAGGERRPTAEELRLVEEVCRFFPEESQAEGYDAGSSTSGRSRGPYGLTRHRRTIHGFSK